MTASLNPESSDSMSRRSSIRALARHFRLGEIALQAFYRPMGVVRDSLAGGGPWQQKKTRLAHFEMVEAAKNLPQMQEPEDDSGQSVSFLSGKNFWHQTLFCFVSLQMNLNFRVTPIIYDDGTLDRDTCDRIKRVIPWAEIVLIETILDKLTTKLPPKRYPSLHERRLLYKHLRKLTDIRSGAMDWQLVLDSDMLFFRRPDRLIEYFRQPTDLYMLDIYSMYGYPKNVMSELVGLKIKDRVNAGLFAFNDQNIDWDLVEHWCKHLLANHGTHYLQEQALTAMLLSKSDVEPLPESEYIVLPNRSEGRNPRGVLHHYVAHSKREYFQHGWRLITAKITTSSNSDS